MLSAALISLSIPTLPHDGQSHMRTDKGISLTLCLQPLQVFELAYHWSSLITCLPCSLALYCSFTTKLCQEASAICFASLRFFIILADLSVSTITAWFSSTRVREYL